MTTNTIQPALTEAEWDAKGVDRIDLWASVSDEILVTRTPGDRSTLAADADRHALAALALYGQPFGFDRSDLWYLRQLQDEGIVRMGEMRDWLTGFATRVAALLPPSEDRYPPPHDPESSP